MRARVQVSVYLVEGSVSALVKDVLAYQVLMPDVHTCAHARVHGRARARMGACARTHAGSGRCGHAVPPQRLRGSRRIHRGGQAGAPGAAAAACICACMSALAHARVPERVRARMCLCACTARVCARLEPAPTGRCATRLPHPRTVTKPMRSILVHRPYWLERPLLSRTKCA